MAYNYFSFLHQSPCLPLTDIFSSSEVMQSLAFLRKNCLLRQANCPKISLMLTHSQILHLNVYPGNIFTRVQIVAILRLRTEDCFLLSPSVLNTRLEMTLSSLCMSSGDFSGGLQRAEDICHTESRTASSNVQKENCQAVNLCSSAKVTSVLEEHLLKSLEEMGRFLFSILLFVTDWKHKIVSPHEPEV